MPLTPDEIRDRIATDIQGKVRNETDFSDVQSAFAGLSGPEMASFMSAVHAGDNPGIGQAFNAIFGPYVFAKAQAEVTSWGATLDQTEINRWIGDG